MKTILLFLSIAFASTIVQAAAKSLCKDGEKIIFNCKIQQKMASVCASSSTETKGRFVQYRFGTEDKIEISIPKTGIESVKVGNLTLAGGGGMFMSFKKEEVEYVPYSSISNQGEKAGVLVQKSQKKLKNLISNSGCKFEMTSDEVIKFGIPVLEDVDYEF